MKRNTVEDIARIATLLMPLGAFLVYMQPEIVGFMIWLATIKIIACLESKPKEKQ